VPSRSPERTLLLRNDPHSEDLGEDEGVSERGGERVRGEEERESARVSEPSA